MGYILIYYMSYALYIICLMGYMRWLEPQSNTSIIFKKRSFFYVSLSCLVDNYALEFVGNFIKMLPLTIKYSFLAFFDEFWQIL